MELVLRKRAFEFFYRARAECRTCTAPVTDTYFVVSLVCALAQQCPQVPLLACLAAAEGGTSTPGLHSKKPLGFNRKPM